ncbi:MAG TPA: Xaa-Pro peptidase family protein [Castellaniella sp.]|uniref:Xaa-Pro peptidase family protein n=1 Tax=Castellaniella sp. TaxID=1955812 RepID=UPI002EE9F54C
MTPAPSPTAISSEEFTRRRAIARNCMEEAGVDVLLVDHAEFMLWLTGYSVSETLYRAFLLPLHGDPWFVVRELDAGPCVAQSRLVDPVTFSDDEDPWSQVAQSLIRRGLASGTVGADFHSYGFSADTCWRLRALLPDARWADLSGISDSLRTVKSPAELHRLASAAAIADSAMQRIADTVQTGWSVNQVAGLVAAHFLQAGADSGETGPIGLGSGDIHFLHALRANAPLTPGSMLHVELTPKVACYSARLMRPVFIGEPAQEVLRAMQTLIALQDAQIRAMKPGVRAADVDAILRQGVLQARLRERYENVTGYTLGLYARTPRPSDFSSCFTPNANWTLEENMVFHMYASAQGFAFSETVVVTPDGGQRLTQTPRHHISVG